jgi:hypothetical protein
MVVLMMRDIFVGLSRIRFENKKADLGIRSAIVFGSAFGSAPRGSAHPGLRPIHRGRSRPGWQNRLLRADSFLMQGPAWPSAEFRPAEFMS